jgi:hypothetical protein
MLQAARLLYRKTTVYILKNVIDAFSASYIRSIAIMKDVSSSFLNSLIPEKHTKSLRWLGVRKISGCIIKIIINQRPIGLCFF